MAVIESIVAKQAEQELKNLNANLEKTRLQILEISKTQLDFNGGGVVKNFNDFNSKMEQSIKIQQKTEAQVERLRLAEIRLQQQREKSVDTFVRNESKEQQALARSETAYNRVQASVTILTKTYQDLAIRKQLGSTLTNKEEAQLLSLTNRLNMYQTALKKVDADVQKHTRNVGNYASGFNGLGNSINQITRELPAFTFSAQTGFLALSNNIPILTDEIGRLIRTNKELVAQGQPVKSVFSQVLSSLFSLQTAMGIGILLFTLYGKEISAFFKDLFSGISTLDAMTEATEALNKVRTDSAKSIVKERVELNANLAVAKNTTLSYRDRQLAAQKVLDQYPYWFENLGKEAILNGNVEEAVKGVNDALLARAKANAAVGLITENQTQIIDLEEKRLTLTKQLEVAQTSYNGRLKIYNETKDPAVNTALAQSEATLNRIRSSYMANEEEISRITAVNNRLLGYANEETGKAIGLDYRSTKAKKEKNEASKDEYNLRKAEIEQEQLYKLAVRDNSDFYYTDRLSMEDDYYELSKELALLSYNEQLRLAKGNQTLQRLALIEYQKDVFKIMQDHNKKVEELEKLRINPQVKLADQDIEKELQASAERTEKRLKEQYDSAERLYKLWKSLNDQTKEYISSFSTGFLNDAGLGSISIFFDDTYKKLMEGAETSSQRFAIAFNSIAEVAQETFNLLNSGQQQYFDNQYARLEKEKDVAIMFAGESETAKAEIEEQYEQRRREIRRREAKAQRELAIFNTVINTAQGVVSALANPGGFAGIALAAVIAGIGAAQISVISSQQEPEFWKGTMNAPEGWAVVDEKRPEVHTDSKGNIKSTGSTKGANRRYLEKGDKIYKSHEFYLDKLLSENGISMHSEMAKSQLSNVVFNGNNSDIASEIKALRSDMRNSNKDGGYKSASITKSGAKEFFEELFDNSQSFNDRVNFKIKKY